MRNASYKIIGKIKTHIMFSERFPENHVVYELMWKIIIEQERPHVPV